MKNTLRIVLLTLGLGSLMMGEAVAQNFQWAAVTNSFGSRNNDNASAVTTDINNNIITVGRWSGDSLDLDPGPGTQMVFPGTGENMQIQAFDPSGNFLWGNSISGTQIVGVSSVSTDASGNVYIAGQFSQTADFDPGPGVQNLTTVGPYDLFLLKLNSSGVFQWAHTIASSSGSVIRDMEVDGNGNVYSVGFYSGTVDFDFGAGTATATATAFRSGFVQKVDSNGDLIWVKTIGENGHADVFSFTIDSNDDLYLTGQCELNVDIDPGAGTASTPGNAGNNGSNYVMKMDGNGNVVWTNFINAQPNSNYSLLKSNLSLDASNNLFFTGTYGDSVDFDPGAGVSAFNPNNDGRGFVWKSDVSGNYLGVDLYDLEIIDMIVLSNGTQILIGDVYGTVDFDLGPGTANGTTSNGLFFLQRDGSGNYLTHFIMDLNNSGDFAEMATDAMNNIYIAGHVKGGLDVDPSAAIFNIPNTNTTDAFLLKYNSCQATTGTDTQTATCSYTWVDGVTYTSSNNSATYTYPGPSGCDSIVTLNLTITSPSTETVTSGTNSLLCSGSTTIDLGSSTNGFSYYLRDDSNDSIIAGPIAGTGSSIGFNTGTLNNTISYNVMAAIPAATALEFVSGPERVVIPNDPALEFTTGVVEMWVRPGNNSNVNRTLIAMRDGLGNDTRWSLHLNTSANTLSIYNGITFVPLTTSGLTVGQWYHVAFVMSTSDTEIFLDGVSIGNTGIGVNAIVTGKDLTIGNHTDPALTTEDFIGRIDDVRIWNVTRTGAQIAAAKDSCLTGAESGLLALYNFESTGQTNVLDITGNGYTGTLTNMDANSAYVTSVVECLSCVIEMQNTVTVTVDGVNDQSANGPTSTELCENGPVTIDIAGSQVGANYYVVDVSNGNAIVSGMIAGTGNALSLTTNTITTAGTLEVYAYSTADSTTCNTQLSVSHTVTFGSVDATVSANQFTITANASGAQYQWVDCNNNYTPIAGETGQSFTATSNGDYAVIVTENNCTDTSACQNITGIGVGEFNLNNQVSVYPNPSNGQFTLTIDGLFDDATISVFDMIGNEVYTVQPVNASTIIDLQQQAAGMYLIHVQTELGTAISRLIID